MAPAESIVDVLQLAEKITSLAYRYIDRAGEASRGLTNLSQELNSLTQVLQFSQTHIKSNPHSEVLRKLDKGELLPKCFAVLQEFQSKIEPKNGSRAHPLNTRQSSQPSSQPADHPAESTYISTASPMPDLTPPPSFKVLQTVKLLLTEPERRIYRRRHMICKIDEINPSYTRLKLLSAWGVIDKWFPLNRVVAAENKLFNPVKGAKYIMLGLRKALMQDRSYGFRNKSHSCVCSTKCRSRYCPCFRAGLNCNDKCHIHHFGGVSETCTNH